MENSKMKRSLLVVGAGGMVGRGTIKHLRDYIADRLTGVEADADRRAEVANTFSIPVYTTIKEAFGQGNIGGVYIATPDHTHKALAIEALSYHVPVLCEKPMGVNGEEARSMLQASKKNKGWLQIGFEYRFSKLYLRVKEIIDSGELGEPVNVICEYCSGPWEESKKWRISLETATGLFYEKLCHIIDLFRYWLNDEVIEVFASSGLNAIPYYPEALPDSCTAIYKFGKGAMGTIIHNHTLASFPWGLEEMCGKLQGTAGADLGAWKEAGHEMRSCIICKKGALIADAWLKTLTVIHRYYGKDMTPHVERMEDYRHLSFSDISHDMAGELLDFVERMDKRLPSRISAEDSYRTTLAVAASEESRRRGEKIKVEVK